MEASFSESQVSIAATKAAQHLGYEYLKAEQLQVVTGVVRGRDVFAVLPTGFGKSLCFAVLPGTYDQLYPSSKPSIVVVLAPLTAIMKDQVASLSSRGLAACYITGQKDDACVSDGVKNGDYQLVLFIPEMLLEKKRWRRMLQGDVYSSRLRALVVDEAHTVKKWGDTFRKALSRVGEIRSLVPRGVVMMALTATATWRLRTQVSIILGMTNEVVVVVSPCKENLMFAVGKFESIAKTFRPMLERLRSEKTYFPRTVIYCRRYEDCSAIYEYFRDTLGRDFTVPADTPDLPNFRLLDMYVSCTEEVVKDEILETFTASNSTLRVIVATCAFGMGVDCPGVRNVIHLGPPSDVESYVQETGRAGRDGQPSLALLLLTPRTHRHTEKTMIDYATNSSECRQDVLFNDFDKYTHVDMGSCLCCDVCAQSCVCGSCDTKHSPFLFIGSLL